MRIAIALLVSGLMFGCGGGDKPAPAKEKAPKPTETTAKPKPAPKKVTPAPAPAPAAAPKVADAVKDDGKVVTVNLTGNDAMKYNLTEINVPAGRTVKLTLKHVGKLAAAAMGHNFVLLKAGTDVTAFATKAASAAATGYIPASEAGSVLAKTKVIGGGQSDTIEFAAPAAGTYDYICTFPGHYAIMRGKLIVK